jgi:hypothetical protein
MIGVKLMCMIAMQRRLETRVTIILIAFGVIHEWGKINVHDSHAKEAGNSCDHHTHCILGHPRLGSINVHDCINIVREIHVIHIY